MQTELNKEHRQSLLAELETTHAAIEANDRLLNSTEETTKELRERWEIKAFLLEETRNLIVEAIINNRIDF